MKIIWLKLVWQMGKLFQECGKQQLAWRCELCYIEGEMSTMPLRNPSPVSISCVLSILNYFFSSHSWFALDFFLKTTFLSCFIIHPVIPSSVISSDELPGWWSFIQSSVWLLKCAAVEICPVTWFSGSLEVNTVGMCTVPTSTESIITAWTLIVTTRSAWVLPHFFWA